MQLSQALDLLGYWSILGVLYWPFHIRDTLHVLDVYMVSEHIALGDDPHYLSLTSIRSTSSHLTTRSRVKASKEATELSDFVF